MLPEDDQPALSPKLIEKLRSADLGSIADLFTEARTGVRRITASEAAELPPIGRAEDDGPQPVSPVEPMAKETDTLYAFVIRSRKVKTCALYQFIATEDWKHLAVPITLLPPECLADPILKEYHWWTGRGAESIVSEETAKAFASEMIREFDGLDYDPHNPDELNITFEVKTPKNTHMYMTRHGWKGLWCPLYMAPEDKKPDSWKYHFVRIISELDIVGKNQVMRYARKHAKDYDKLKIKGPKRTKREGPYRCYYIAIEFQRKLLDVQRWLDAMDPNGCSESRAVCHCIDTVHASLPPESEWKIVKHPLRKKGKSK